MASHRAPRDSVLTAPYMRLMPAYLWAFDVEDEATLRALAARFAEKSEGVLDSIVGAVDGVHIRVRKPSTNGAMYYCRKGFHWPRIT